MKKKMLGILLAGIFVLSAAGCGSGGETNQSEAETEARFRRWKKRMRPQKGK